MKKPVKRPKWIKHTGNECPVHPDTVVKFRLIKNGTASLLFKAKEVSWNHVAYYQIISKPKPKRDKKGKFVNKSSVSRAPSADTGERFVTENSTVAAAQEATPGEDNKYKIGDLVIITKDEPCKSALRKDDLVRIRWIGKYCATIQKISDCSIWSIMIDDFKPLMSWQPSLEIPKGATVSVDGNLYKQSDTVGIYTKTPTQKIKHYFRNLFLALRGKV